MKTSPISNPQQALDCLARCHWFDDLPEAGRAELVGGAHWRSVDSGEHVYRVSGMPDGVYGVCSGSVKILVGDDEGREAVIDVVAAGQWFGSLALLSGDPHFADSVALAPSELLFVPRPLLLGLAERWPVVYRNLATSGSRAAAAAMWMAAQYMLANPEMRLAQRLSVALQWGHTRNDEEWVTLRNRVSHELLAGMLGLSRPRLTLAVQALTRAGVMAAERGWIRVNRVRLKAYLKGAASP